MSHQYDEMMSRLLSSTLLVIKVISGLIVWALISIGFQQVSTPGLDVWILLNAAIIGLLIFRSQLLVKKYEHMQTFENFYDFLDFLNIKPKDD